MSLNPLLLEGLTDAAGFVGGVLCAYWLSVALGFDPLASVFGDKAIAGIVLSGIGGGIGVQVARRLRGTPPGTGK